MPSLLGGDVEVRPWEMSGLGTVPMAAIPFEQPLFGFHPPLGAFGWSTLSSFFFNSPTQGSRQGFVSNLWVDSQAPVVPSPHSHKVLELVQSKPAVSLDLGPGGANLLQFSPSLLVPALYLSTMALLVHIGCPTAPEFVLQGKPWQGPLCPRKALGM